MPLQTIQQKKAKFDAIHLLGVGMVVAGAIGFASKAILVKVLYRYNLDTSSILTLRMLFSLPFFLLVIYYYRKKKFFQNLSSKDKKLIPLMGFLGYYLSSLLDFLGLQYVSAGLERLILFIYPTIVIFLSVLLFKKKIYTRQILALLLTYSGVVLAMTTDFTIKNQYFALGALLIFCSACTYAVYLIGSERILSRVDSILYSAWVMLFATGFIILHNILFGKLNLLHLPSDVYWLSLLMAIIATVIPIFLTVEGIKLIGANNMSIVGNIGPISTILMAYIILDEPIFFWQMVGTGLVLVGIFLIGTKKKSDSKVK